MVRCPRGRAVLSRLSPGDNTPLPPGTLWINSLFGLVFSGWGFPFIAQHDRVGTGGKPGVGSEWAKGASPDRDVMGCVFFSRIPEMKGLLTLAWFLACSKCWPHDHELPPPKKGSEKELILHLGSALTV